jgi:hypothetical protein
MAHADFDERAGWSVDMTVPACFDFIKDNILASCAVAAGRVVVLAEFPPPRRNAVSLRALADQRRMIFFRSNAADALRTGLDTTTVIENRRGRRRHLTRLRNHPSTRPKASIVSEDTRLNEGGQQIVEMSRSVIDSPWVKVAGY